MFIIVLVAAFDFRSIFRLRLGATVCACGLIDWGFVLAVFHYFSVAVSLLSVGAFGFHSVTLAAIFSHGRGLRLSRS